MLTGHKELVLCLEKKHYYVNRKPYSYHIISAEIFLSRFHDHSPFQCNWSAIQWWCGLRTLVHHTFLDGCWETRVCCQSQACIQSVCSSLEKQTNKKQQDPMVSKKRQGSYIILNDILFSKVSKAKIRVPEFGINKLLS